MNVVITGSLGHISKPLVTELVQKGNSVTVISSKLERQKEIELLGAKAAIGSVNDVTFLTKTFNGHDAVYTMQPPPHFGDQSLDMGAYWLAIVGNYREAIKESGVKKVIHLSSIGAHTKTGVGILGLYWDIENILKELPLDVTIKFMRPVGFYYNMFAFIPTIKSQGVIVQNYGGDQKEPWVSPLDIAGVIAEEMEKPFAGRTFRYIASDEVSPNEIAGILGNAIGKPDLKWLAIPDEQVLKGMVGSGMNENLAKGFVQMNASRRNGLLYADYNQNKPAFGKVTLQDFAKEFAVVFSQ